MGIESRDWYREESRNAGRHSRGTAVVIVLFVLALVVAVAPPVRDRLGYELPLGLEGVFPREGAGELQLQLVPGGPTLGLTEQELYPRDDPWKASLADEQTCPGGEDGDALPRAQLRAMLCLVNFAREHQGLRPLAASGLLSTSSGSKAADIARCNDFAHEACGAAADRAARRLGYQGSFGENLYIAEGALGVPRVALDRWLNSPGHRENLFQPSWRVVGIARLEGADASRVEDGVVWVTQFGD